MPQEQMPDKIWVSSCGDWFDYDTGDYPYSPASRLSALAERVERAEGAYRDEREHRAIADEAAKELGAELNAASERLQQAEALLKEVREEFSGSCRHCAYWNWQSNGLMTRISSFLHDGKVRP